MLHDRKKINCICCIVVPICIVLYSFYICGASFYEDGKNEVVTPAVISKLNLEKNSPGGKLVCSISKLWKILHVALEAKL